MVLRKIENKSFIRSSEGAIASYNYEDIASGLGYALFYPMTTASWNGSSNAETYFLSNKIRGSNSKYLKDIEGKSFSFDSSPFNTPREVEGEALIGYSCGLKRDSVGTGWGYFKFDIIKVSGGVETSIGTGNSPRVSSALDRELFPNKVAKITLTKMNFKIGDFLRLKITFKTRFNDEDYDFLYLGCNPLNDPEVLPDSMGTLTSTILIVEIPFRIDL